ncbi:MAG: type IV secretion system protein [Coxiellaceae bacterium]|nr:type IV secretion system protein [Coxiellaceae bacterium]
MSVSNAPVFSHFIQQLLSQIDTLLGQYVFDGYHALSHYLEVPLGLVTSIYIVILGYAIVMGWVKVSLNHFVKAVLKIALIYMAVTQWGWVSHYFIGFIQSAMGELGNALLQGVPNSLPSSGGINDAMQVTLNAFLNLGSTVFKSGGFMNLGGWLDGLLIWLFGCLIIGLSLFELILAKVMLSVLFVFTPLLVIFCYFKPFQAMFDRWLGAIVGFALLQLFVTSALTLALSLAYWWISPLLDKTPLQIGNYGSLPVIIVGIICIGLVMKAAELAQNVGGTVSTSAGNAMVGGLVGAAIGSTVATYGKGKTAFLTTKSLAGVGKNVLQSSYAGAKSVMQHVRSKLSGGE